MSSSLYLKIIKTVLKTNKKDNNIALKSNKNYICQEKKTRVENFSPNGKNTASNWKNFLTETLPLYYFY